PLSSAVDAVERGIERRAARVWTPRWVGAAIVLRGLVQPLLERLAGRDSDQLVAAMRLAEDAGYEDAIDPQLGVSAQALRDPARR
ncbi:MAG TPA: hypothetical protein VEJ23_02785, partial [Solirubrobacteraceae bacterium]|nr:hypothetical protein [Solirubrobacteraceae bacterium]